MQNNNFQIDPQYLAGCFWWGGFYVCSN